MNPNFEYLKDHYRISVTQKDSQNGESRYSYSYSVLQEDVDSKGRGIQEKFPVVFSQWSHPTHPSFVVQDF